MKLIKKFLLKILGERNYLFFLATCYQWLYRTGWLGEEYQDVYFLKKIVHRGDIAVDIGAHLGYYTFELSRLTGKDGKVIAIEPVSKFNSVIEKLAKNSPNINLLKVALGGRGETVEIGIPLIQNQKRFGHARIKEMHEHMQYAETESVPNVNGDILLKDLPRLDFIKCDVEGAEVPVFTSLLQTIQKHTPIILCEIGDKIGRIKMYDMLNSSGYSPYMLKNGKLNLLDINTDNINISPNYYFIPANKLRSLKGLIN